MTDTPAEVVESVEPRRSPRHWRRMVLVLTITLLLFGVPWWTLLAPSASWPTAVFVVGTLLFAAAFVAMPALMVLGHGRRHIDWAAATGDTLLGAAWVMFVWSLLGQSLHLVLLIAGVGDPVRSRLVAGAVLGVVVMASSVGSRAGQRRDNRTDPRPGPNSSWRVARPAGTSRAGAASACIEQDGGVGAGRGHPLEAVPWCGCWSSTTNPSCARGCAPR